MAPTIETAPTRRYYVQLRPSQSGEWAPEATVIADTVCEKVTGDDGTFHLFKKGETVVAKYLSTFIVGWRIEEG